MRATSPCLTVANLAVSFSTPEGMIRAVDGVDLSIEGPETVALVGESGCGKSVTALALANLVTAAGATTTGAVRLNGREVLAMTERELTDLRGRLISYIFQDPASSLNPVLSVGSQIAEAIRLHRRGVAAREEVIKLLRLVGLPDPEHRRRSYPHQLSGGMQQRVMIAMALACHPQILVADEPTTALDVTIQAQIYELLGRLQTELRMAVLLVTHNLGLVAANADRVYVMYAGQIVESGPTSRVLRAPAHPYTRGLLAAVPRLRRGGARMQGIDGTVPNPAQMPAGCRFHPRCRQADDRCRRESPAMQPLTDGQCARCHFLKQTT
jgi:peptide/nickel transport system ATP-binding protein